MIGRRPMLGSQAVAPEKKLNDVILRKGIQSLGRATSHPFLPTAQFSHHNFFSMVIVEDFVAPYRRTLVRFTLYVA